MWLTLAVALCAAGPRPPLALRGGGAPESELLDSLNTAKLRLHALEHRLKTSLDARASDTEASPDRAEGLEPVLAEPEAGDRVRVRRDVATPRYEWGEGVDHASVGRLTWCAASWHVRPGASLRTRLLRAVRTGGTRQPTPGPHGTDAVPHTCLGRAARTVAL